MNRLRHLTYANVCATLALFVAVSTGGAYAKATMIDGRHIKPNSIPASALKNNSVTSAKIKNGQVVGVDVKKGSLAPTVFNATTQQAIASIGSNTSTPTGNGETGTTTTQDGKTWEYALVDVVPKGAGLPCRVMNQSYPNGAWELMGGSWVCKFTLSNGSIGTSQPATKGSPNTSGSGAVNA